MIHPETSVPWPVSPDRAALEEANVARVRGFESIPAHPASGNGFSAVPPKDGCLVRLQAEAP
jgi:hypothetical protein